MKSCYELLTADGKTTGLHDLEKIDVMYNLECVKYENNSECTCRPRLYECGKNDEKTILKEY
jgi:hypothetical protein